MFRLPGCPTPMQIELTAQICETINRAVTRGFLWPVRLIMAVVRYPARRRECMRRRSHRAAMDDWAEDFVDLRIHGMEKVLLAEAEFLADVRDALRHTSIQAFDLLVPDLDYHIWVTGESPKRSRWKVQVTSWVANLDDGVKIVAFVYLVLIGIVAFAIGLVFACALIGHLVDTI